MQLFKVIAGTIIAIGLVVYLSVIYIYSKQYVQTSEIEATKGIMFKKTLNLPVYEKVSTGNGWLGKYARYSRSDRHSEVITVYCKEFCEGTK